MQSCALVYKNYLYQRIYVIQRHRLSPAGPDVVQIVPIFVNNLSFAALALAYQSLFYRRRTPVEYQNWFDVELKQRSDSIQHKFHVPVI